MRDAEKAVGVAVQIAYEYKNWGDEHVSDMYRTFADCGEPAPCSSDTLYDLTWQAAELEKKGVNYQEAVETLLKKHKRG